MTNVERKIDLLLEQANTDGNVYLEPGSLEAAAFKSMNQKDQNRILDTNYANNQGLKSVPGSLGHGLLWGGLVGGGTALANATMGTNFDPVMSGLLTGGATAALNTPGNYMNSKDNAQETQDFITNAKRNGNLDKLSNSLDTTLKQGGIGQERDGLINYQRGIM